MGSFDDLIPGGSSQGGSGAFDDLIPKKSSLARRVLGDTGVSALKGAVGLTEVPVGIADILTGGNAGKALEGIGYRPKEAKAALDEYFSPEQKAANQYVQESDGFLDTVKRGLSRPSVIVQSVVESLPLLLPGAAAARGIGAATKVAPYIAGAAGEGLVGAGSAAEQLRQGSEDGTISGKQTLGALASGVGTAGFGALGGKLASSAIGKKLGISDIDTVLAGGASNPANVGLAKRALSGAVSEGVLEELPQSMWEQAAQNYATDKPLGEGVGQAGAMGLLAGTAMGGTFNAMQRGEQRKAVDDANPAVEETPAAAPLGLTYNANVRNGEDPLYTFPDGSTMSRAEYEQDRANKEQGRLDSMIQPADPEPKLPENGPMAAALNVGIDSGATSLRPQGSFSDMSEFANPLGEERQDVQSRRTGIAGRQALQREVALQDADQRVADQMAKEAAQRRRAVLDQVLSDPTTQNPADRFAAELQRQGFRDSTPTADELATVQRFNDIKAAEPAGPEIEPSLPNELDAEQLGIRSRKGSSGAQSSGRDKVAEVRQLVADGWKISNKTLVSPTGKKRILNTAEHAAAKEATRERNLARMVAYKQVNQAKGKGNDKSEMGERGEGERAVSGSDNGSRATESVSDQADSGLGKARSGQAGSVNGSQKEELGQSPQAPQANDAQVESQPSAASQAEGVAQPKPVEATPAVAQSDVEDYGKRVVRRNKPVSKWTAEEIQDRLARADSGESPISDESRSQLQAALEPLVAANKEKEAKAAEQAERVKKMQAAKAANKDTFQIGENKDSLERVSVRNGVVHLGDYPATDYDSGDEITVPDGATKQQVLDALIAGEAVTKKAKVWGKNGPEQSVADRIAELQAERDAMTKSEQRAAEAIQSAMEVAAGEGVAEAEVMAELGAKNEEVGQAERSNQESQVGNDVGSQKPARSGDEERNGDAQGQEREVTADGRVSSDAKQSTAKTKETEKGVAMFSRDDVNASRGQGNGMAFRDLQAVVDRISKGFNNLPKIHVLDSPRDLSDRRDNERTLKEQIEQAGAMDDVEGAHHNGEIYLFASGIASEERAEHVLATHEITHYGLRGTMGKGLDSALQNIWLHNKEIRAKAAVLRTQLGLSSNVSAVEEVLAEMKDSDLVKLKGWRKMVQAFRDWAHKAGFDRIAAKLDGMIANGMSDQEKADLFVANMVNSARDWVRNGKPQRGYDPGTSMLGDANFSAKGDTINVDGIDRPVTNSNGKPIAQTKEGLRNFWRWFGDSKVVDSDGRPLVTYHGTASDIKEFRPSGGRDGEWQKALDHFKSAQKNNERYGYMNFRAGSFFSPKPEYAGNYTGENTGVMYPAYLKLDNPVYFDMSRKNQASGVDANKTPDGLILYSGQKSDINEVAVIDPTQVKSAIGNNGNFDASNPNIQLSRNKPASVDASITEIFDGLAGRGLKKQRAEERLAEHPQAESIRYVQDNILDILEELEGAGTIKINC